MDTRTRVYKTFSDLIDAQSSCEQDRSIKYCSTELYSTVQYSTRRDASAARLFRCHFWNLRLSIKLSSATWVHVE